MDLSNFFIMECKNCNRDDMFVKYRNVEEIDYLRIDDGYVSVDDSDIQPTGEWIFECSHCGEMSDCIEDLLVEREDEDA